jgi:cellulose synthase/poly-beta-1,6-N-acetylglucosamine synthase-like glycosyltransferase
MQQGEICVLTPAHNEYDVLDEALASARREVGRKHVYLVDDASTDNTSKIGWYWAGRDHTLTLPTNSGKARAFEAAIKHFDLTNRYRAIFFMDSDTVLGPGHVEAVLQALDAKPQHAFAVGKIESRYVDPKTFWVRYRAYVMWLYNSTIRLPQNTLGVINVLPGSSVLIRSSVVASIDWNRTAGFALDDYHTLVQILLQKLGKGVYAPSSPPALIREPLTTTAYLKQTRRWWFGIGEIHRREGLWTKFRPWFLFNNAHILSWIWAAISPVLILITLLFLHDIWWAFDIATVGVLWALAEATILCTIYTLRTGRVSALILLPAFLVVVYLESCFFCLCFFGAVKAKRGGTWASPPRVIEGG